MTDPTKTDQSLWCGMSIPIIGLTGPKASGKTLFASTIDPKNTLIVDCELGSETYESGDSSYSIQYGQRVDIFTELEKRGKEPTPLEAWLLFKELVETTKHRVVVVDTWDFIQSGLVKWIESDPAKFGRSRNEYEKFASATLWPDVKSWFQGWLGSQAKRIGGTIVLINHMGTIWKDGKATDKQKAKGLDVIYQVASVYLRLDRSPDNSGKVPSAPTGFITEVLGGKCRLVRFRKNEKGELIWSRDKDGRPTQCADPILPPKIENCTPEMIRWYIQNPPDYAKLKKSELAPLEVMSDDAKLELKAKIAEDQAKAAEARLSALEMMKAAGQRRATEAAGSRLPTSATPASAPTTTPAASSPAQPKAEAVVKPPEPAADVPFAVDSSSGKPAETETAASEKSVFEIIEEQRQQLGITNEQWAGVLAKTGAKTTSELSAERAEELRKKMWNQLTARDMGKA